MRLFEFSCTHMTEICDNLRGENVSTSAYVGRLAVTHVFFFFKCSGEVRTAANCS